MTTLDRVAAAIVTARSTLATGSAPTPTAASWLRARQDLDV
jgi:hypothetical protein